MCPFHPFLSIILIVSQKIFDVNPPGSPRRYRNEPELVVQNIENHNHPDSVGRREIHADIRQTAPVGRSRDLVPRKQFLFGLRMSRDQLPQVRLADHVHFLMLAK